MPLGQSYAERLVDEPGSSRPRVLLLARDEMVVLDRVWLEHPVDDEVRALELRAWSSIQKGWIRRPTSSSANRSSESTKPVHVLPSTSGRPSGSFVSIARPWRDSLPARARSRQLQRCGRHAAGGMLIQGERAQRRRMAMGALTRPPMISKPRRWLRCTGCRAPAPGAEPLPGPEPSLHRRLTVHLLTFDLVAVGSGRRRASIDSGRSAGWPGVSRGCRARSAAHGRAGLA